MAGPASRIIWDWRSREGAHERERVRLRLKQEGIVQGLVVIALGFIAKSVLKRETVGDILVVLGAFQGLAATWRPLWLLPLRRLGRGLGRVVAAALTGLLLVPFFALVMVPGALMKRVRGRDPLGRRPLAIGLTAWIPRRSAPSAASLSRQFLTEDRQALALRRPEGTLPDPAILAELDADPEVRA